MSAETRDAEALAGLLYECHSDASDAPWESIKRLGLDAVYQRQARRLLASDWLVEHVASHVNEALEQAAQRVEAQAKRYHDEVWAVCAEYCQHSEGSDCYHRHDDGCASCGYQGAARLIREGIDVTEANLMVSWRAHVAEQIAALRPTALEEAERERDMALRMHKVQFERANRERDRAEQAGASERRLREGVEALADECADSACIHLNTLYGHLRALLAEGGA